MFEIIIKFIIPTNIEELKKYVKNNASVLHFESHKREDKTVFYLVHYKELKTILYSFKGNGLLDYVKFGIHNKYTLQDIEQFKKTLNNDFLMDMGVFYWSLDMEKEE